MMPCLQYGVVRHLMSGCFIAILSLTFIINASGQNGNNSPILKAEIKCFLSDIRSQELAKEKIVMIKEPFRFTTHDIAFYIFDNKDIFSASDSSYMFQQTVQSGNLILDTTFIDNTSFISNATVINIFKKNKITKGWDIFYKKYGKGYYRISLPVFTKEMCYCIVEILYACGSLCASDCFLIFKRVDNKWTLYRKLDCSVS